MEKKCLYWSYFVFCLYLYRALFSSTLYCYCTTTSKIMKTTLLASIYSFLCGSGQEFQNNGYYINLKTQIIQKFMHIF